MTSSFSGLDMALRALHAQQAAIDTTNHNVANANTPGFSRQNVVMEATSPYTLPGMNRDNGAGQLGTGVIAVAIQRARDVFADLQYRAEYAGQKEAEVTQDALAQIEMVFNEPSDNGLGVQFDKFFNAWQDLANDPNDPSARQALLSTATTFVNGFNRAAQQLTAVQSGLNDQINLQVTQLNSLAGQVASLNRQIVQVEALGQKANDFRDRRDLLLDQISALVPATVNENTDGSVTVMLGTHSLVQGPAVDTLQATPTGPGGMWDVRFSSDNSLATITGGQMKGLLDARDQIVPNYAAKLDAIASSVIMAVNGLHSAGYGQDGVTGRPFFAGASAATIAIDPAISGDVRHVAAASAPNQAGNNTTALAIAQLRQTMSPAPGAAYNALIADLGVQGQAAKGQVENQTVLAKLLDNRREAVSGVSVDEEMVQMLRYQRAYEASARCITAYDQMLDKLINGTGIVGR